MSGLAIVIILWGVLVIVVRAPLLFAPAGTLAVYRKLLDTPGRIRLLGVAVALLAFALVATAWGSDAPGAALALVLGLLFMGFTVLLLLVFTDLYQFGALAILGAMRNMLVVRLTGLFATAFGLWIIYLGLAVG